MKNVSDIIFKDFNEFWSYTKFLNSYQRDIIYSNLPQEERDLIGRSYHNGCWEDLFMRNKLDDIIDGLQKDFNINLIEIRIKVLKGKCHYMKKAEWNFINDILSSYPEKHTEYILGGVNVEDVDNKTICLIRNI